MTTLTFTPPFDPSSGCSDEPEVKILKAEFGDGYSQAARDGMNSIRRVLSLKWDVLTVAEAQTMIAFFAANAGCDPFYYTMPDDAAPTLWTCEKWNEGYSAANLRSVTATFRQNFNLV